MFKMKRAGLLAGILTLALLGSCVLAVDASEGKTGSDRSGSPRETVRLLEEKLGYLQEVESKLREGLAAAKDSSMTTDSQMRDIEVRLLEARARRVDVQLELARWRSSKGKRSKGSKRK
jgi:hypothetical protein